MAVEHLPKLSARSESMREVFHDISVVALPIVATNDGTVALGNCKGLDRLLEKKFSLSLSEILSRASGLSGKAGEVFDFPLAPSESGKDRSLHRILFVGIGESSLWDFRKAGTVIGRKIKGSDAHVLSACAHKSADITVHAVAIGLSVYSWSMKSGSMKSGSMKSGPKPTAPEFSLWGDCEKELSRARIDIEAVWCARNLIHTPANIASPAWLATQAKKYSQRPSMTVKVRAGRELKEFGGLLAVGNSSHNNPPRMIEITYAPRGARKNVVLVGKGITFDTGGLSLKRPYDIMAPMKTDMSGAAAVLSVVNAAAELKLPIKVTALMMCAENLVSATAQRPSDVITHYGGTTVEVIDTDAEGRLVLADGLAYADRELNPDYLVDVATLTGAAKLGLGLHHAALYTRDEKLARTFVGLGEKSGDRSWHMPLVDDYEPALASFVADFNHTADALHFSGGSITAALFLEKFVGDRRWVHLDIAGPARSEKDEGENPKGGTGFSVRLLTHWLETL